MSRLNKDFINHIQSKLSGEWSASQATNLLAPEILEQLIAKFSKLEPMVRVRILLACMFLSPDQVEEMKSQLDDLGAAARDDDDDWVRMMAYAVDGFNGRLSFERVMDAVPMVRGTMEELKKVLESTTSSHPVFFPSQEAWLSSKLRHPNMGKPPSVTQHFQLRDPATVKTADAVMGAREDLATQPSEEPTSVKGQGNVHAKRGKGTSGESDMLRSRKTELHRGLSVRLPSEARAAVPLSQPGPGSLRTKKMKQLEIGEVAALNRQPLATPITPASTQQQPRTPRRPADQVGGDLRSIPEGPTPAHVLEQFTYRALVDPATGMDIDERTPGPLSRDSRAAPPPFSREPSRDPGSESEEGELPGEVNILDDGSNMLLHKRQQSDSADPSAVSSAPSSAPGPLGQPQLSTGASSPAALPGNGPEPAGPSGHFLDLNEPPPEPAGVGRLWDLNATPNEDT